MRLRATCVAALSVLAIACQAAGAPDALTGPNKDEAVPLTLEAWQASAFGPLASMVGRTWRGEPVEGSAGPADISRWEWALGGKVIRTVHALADGSYGGETLIYVDAGTGGCPMSMSPQRGSGLKASSS